MSRFVVPCCALFLVAAAEVEEQCNAPSAEGLGASMLQVTDHRDRIVNLTNGSNQSHHEFVTWAEMQHSEKAANEFRSEVDQWLAAHAVPDSHHDDEDVPNTLSPDAERAAWEAKERQAFEARVAKASMERKAREARANEESARERADYEAGQAKLAHIEGQVEAELKHLEAMMNENSAKEKAAADHAHRSSSRASSRRSEPPAENNLVPEVNVPSVGLSVESSSSKLLERGLEPASPAAPFSMASFWETMAA